MISQFAAPVLPAFSEKTSTDSSLPSYLRARAKTQCPAGGASATAELLLRKDSLQTQVPNQQQQRQEQCAGTAKHGDECEWKRRNEREQDRCQTRVASIM
ncbi:hypothetical protein K438DRAFT_1992692 [Mycena galopus ATCC 62051]|nr:hypothetical protein K438DRAFT_1992692 [Mycena galopus ATCC 62051]